MLKEDLMLVVGKDSKFSKISIVEFSNLADFPLALPSRANVLRTVLEKNAANEKINLNVEIDCDSLTTLIKLANSGFAIVLPHFAINKEIFDGDLIAIPIVNPTPFWRLSVVVSKRTLNIPGAHATAQLMAETIGILVKQGTWRAQSVSSAPPSLSSVGHLTQDSQRQQGMSYE
jgi:DNA-binding transcriptional LysR family regulator